MKSDHLDQADDSPERRGSETTYYRYVRALDGSLVPIDLVKQTGRLVPRFVPESRQEAATRSLTEFLEFYRVIMYGLNRLERRTWVPLLLGQTPEDVARSHHVTRQAILARLRGNKGRGGMIRKNVFVLAWWLVGKKKLNQHH